MPSAVAASARRLPPVSFQKDGAADSTGFENEIIEHFADLAVMLAQPRSYGQIYGLLFASTRPLSFTDIVERLALSKGSVSLGLKALRAVGAIRPTDGPDWRREHFAAETELRMLIGGFLRESIQPQLKRGSLRLGELGKRHRTLLADRSGSGRVLQQRLAKLQSWHRKGGTLLPLVARFLG